MLIAPITNVQNLYSRNIDNKKQTLKFANKPLEADTVSFSAGIKPEVLRNQAKILFAECIAYGKKINILMPTNDMEREVACEMLAHRKKLDKYFNLISERDAIRSQLADLRELKGTNPNSPEIKVLEEALNKGGKPEEKIEALNKQILFEEKLRADSIKYFEEIDNLKDEYTEKHIAGLTYGKLKKYWDQLQKNGLNSDGKYSAQDLLDIISGKKPLETVKPSEAVKPVRVFKSKDDVLDNIQKQYQEYLKEHINLYMGKEHGREASMARVVIEKENKALIEKFGISKKELIKRYNIVQRTFETQTDNLGEVDIYPIGEIWKDMIDGVAEMKGYIKEINSLKEQLAQKPKSIKLKKALAETEKKLATTKTDWTGALEYSIKYEKINRERFEAAGSVQAYDFLTAENKMIKKYKELDVMRAENNGVLPEEIWAEILAA